MRRTQGEDPTNDKFSNPFYPLKGPPRNEEEKRILAEAIAYEKDQVVHLAGMKQRADVEIKKTAESNCADLQWEYFQCMKTGPWKDRLSGCYHQQTKHLECVDAQKKLLTEFGYAAAVYERRSKEERIMIADMADKAYLEGLSRKATEADTGTTNR